MMSADVIETSDFTPETPGRTRSVRKSKMQTTESATC